VNSPASPRFAAKFSSPVSHLSEISRTPIFSIVDRQQPDGITKHGLRADPAVVVSVNP
jgi:hypothetical protein